MRFFLLLIAASAFAADPSSGKKVHQVDKQDVSKPMRLHLIHRVSEAERPSLNLKELPDDVDIDWVKSWK